MVWVMESVGVVSSRLRCYLWGRILAVLFYFLIEVINIKYIIGLFISFWFLLFKFNFDRYIGILILLYILCGYEECKVGEIVKFIKYFVVIGRIKINVID